MILKIGTEEHFKNDIKSHIPKHLSSNMACFDLHNPLFFKTIYKPDSIFDFKIRVALLINWHKPDLNAEQRIQNLSVKFGGQLFVLFCFDCGFHYFWYLL